MSEAKAGGVLYGALEKLAWHYGLVNTRTIKEKASNMAYRRGRQDTLQQVMSLAELSAVGEAKEALLKFGQTLKNLVEKNNNAG